MKSLFPFARARRLMCVLFVWGLLVPDTAALAGDVSVDPQWLALWERSREALASVHHPVAGESAVVADRHVVRVIMVGFTGGREGADSHVSGVVSLRRRIEASLGDDDRLVAVTYNNRDWLQAATDVRALSAPTAASDGGSPLIVAVGHSWGAGAITKFARKLRGDQIEVTLAVFVDAFSLRNPRVPDNVRYAVNFYQRSGPFRGFLFRGKRKLILEDPAATTVLANLKVTPRTEHFGWHWNLVQPLFYRQHHRLGHDIRLHEYVLDLVSMGLADEDALDPAGEACAPDTEECRIRPAQRASTLITSP